MRTTRIPRGAALFAAFLLALAGGCSDDESTEPEVDNYVPALEAAFQGGFVPGSYPGMAVAVLTPGRDLWTAAAGFSNAAMLDSIEVDMTFGAANVTMNFVGALILKLVEDGEIVLDVPISTYLGPTPNVNGNATVRQLLNHTSGVFDVGQSQTFVAQLLGDPDRIWTPQEVLGFVQEPPFGPGAMYGFSYTNYVLLGLIAESVGGAALVDQIRARLLSPLGLTGVSLAGAEPVLGDVPDPHVDLDSDGAAESIGDRSRTSWTTALWASAALFASAEELVRWGDALYTGRVLDEPRLTQMVNFAAADNEFVLRTGTGLGTEQWMLRAREFWGYIGEAFGFTAILFHSPVDDITVAVLANASGDPNPAVQLAVDLQIAAASNR